MQGSVPSPPVQTARPSSPDFDEGRGPRRTTSEPTAQFGPPTVDSSQRSTPPKTDLPGRPPPSVPIQVAQQVANAAAATPDPESRLLLPGVSSGRSDSRRLLRPFGLPASPPPVRTRSQSPGLAGMPFEVSELFSMAPLSWGRQPTENKIPAGFSMGQGNVLALQEKLLEKYESLGKFAKRYNDGQGKAAHFGLEPFKSSMDEDRKLIKVKRDEAVEIMKAIYHEGQKPLPPDEVLDKDVARILDVPLMTSASVPAKANIRGNSEAESSKSATVRGKDKAGSSKSSNVRGKDMAESSKTTTGRPHDLGLSCFIPAPKRKTAIWRHAVDAPPSRGSSGAAARRAVAAWNTRARTGRMGRVKRDSEGNVQIYRQSGLGIKHLYTEMVLLMELNI